MLQYIEIKLLPDPEFPPVVLMNALYGKLHRLLTTLDACDIGVGFPDVESAGGTLGLRLRLFGEAATFARIADTDWMKGMRDHCSVSSATDVPDDCMHRVVRRIQVKSNPERLRRRMAKRKAVSLAAAAEAIPDKVAQQSNLPYVKIRSQSTGQIFPIFIEHGPLLATPVTGRYNAYGLSLDGATIPWI
jgi:CRISPR-associated endonuclease Csy4